MLTCQDWLFEHNLLVARKPQIRSFAAASSISAEGEVFVVLAIFEKQPRKTNGNFNINVLVPGVLVPSVLIPGVLVLALRVLWVLGVLRQSRQFTRHEIGPARAPGSSGHLHRMRRD